MQLKCFILSLILFNIFTDFSCPVIAVDIFLLFYRRLERDVIPRVSVESFSPVFCSMCSV